jgi:hypothetical protein
MEAENSLSCSKEAFTDPYPKPARTFPYCFFKIHFEHSMMYFFVFDIGLFRFSG